MTFQFACRKLQRSKDLEPAVSYSWTVNIEDPPSFGGVNEPMSQSKIRRLLAESAVVWRKPRTMNNVPRDMRYAIRYTQYAIRAPSLYICRESSTNQPFLCKTNPISERPKWMYIHIIQLFMKIFSRWRGKKTNPNKPNLRKAKMNVNLTFTKDYIKKDDFVVRINKPNFFKGPKWT